MKTIIPTTRTANGGGVEYVYVYDDRLVLQERDGNNLPLVTYTRGNDLSGSREGAGGIGGLLARTDNGKLLLGDSSANAYYHCDGNGNVTALVNTNGAIVARYHYDPYGNLLSMSGPLAQANTYRFSSKEAHANSGLIYYLYRYYSPSLQRWVNRDPIDECGGVNLYAYVFNAPFHFVDTYGLQCFIGGIPPILLSTDQVIPRPLIEQAIELNRGASRVRLPDGREMDLYPKPGSTRGGHLDKATGERIPEPHVHEPNSPHPPGYENFSRGVQDVPRPATIQDIQDAISHLQNNPNVSGFGGCSNCGRNAPSITPPKSPPPTKPESPGIPNDRIKDYCPMAQFKSFKSNFA